MAYTPPLGSAIVLELVDGYTPPAGGAIVLGLGINFTPPVVGAAAPGFAVPWGEYPRKDSGPSPGWADRRPVNVSIGMAWIKRLSKNGCSLRSPWQDKNSNDQSKRLPWEQLSLQLDGRTSSPWKNKPANDHRKTAAWQASRIVQVNKFNPSFSPPPKERFVVLAYKDFPARDRGAFSVPWGNPPPKDRWHRTLWGKKYYLEICFRKYRPPVGGAVILNFNNRISQVGDGDHIDFYFDKLTYDLRCSQREQSGWRDAYFYRKPDVLSAPWATVYTMLNTTSLTRLPERTPVDITSMTISTDWDSLYWTFSATVGSDAALALLEPTEDGPIIVEAAINGHLWKLQAESWTTGHTFGRKSRSISGRSLSAQLGAPMAEIRTYTETNQRTAAQLIAYELEDTGWSAVMNIDDWLVPANVHSYQDQTPMAVIKMIADTCRAMVQTSMAAETLAIKPRYRVKPWLLAAATPDIIIPASMAGKVDGGWDERPFFNSVFVAGEAGGISATVTREGSAGDLSAPMITSKLITAVEPATALGIAVLGGSGKWSKHRIELPVFTPPAVPGIILPGSIIEYNLGTSSWRGFVSAVSATSQRTKEGLKVRQTIDVERYHGN